jgi:hypothetical protein
VLVALLGPAIARAQVTGTYLSPVDGETVGGASWPGHVVVAANAGEGPFTGIHCFRSGGADLGLLTTDNGGGDWTGSLDFSGATDGDQSFPFHCFAESSAANYDLGGGGAGGNFITLHIDQSATPGGTTTTGSTTTTAATFSTVALSPEDRQALVDVRHLEGWLVGVTAFALVAGGLAFTFGRTPGAPS